MSIILLPLAFDIILIAPGVATSLLFLLKILPLGLITVVILRIIYSELLIKVLPYIYTKLQSIKNKFELEIDNSKKYGQATLTAVSLGATIGPSTFILIPYTIVRYGLPGIIGFILASFVSWLLAWRYSTMYYYAKYMMGKEVVGGPAFVKYGYGERDPRYLLSRFMMWIGNSALTAFNMLIVIDIFSVYLFKPILGFEMPILYKALLLLLLSLAVLALHRTWEHAISLQIYITLSFIILFLIHIIAIGNSLNITSSTITLSFTDTHLDFLIYILSASAYVYIVAFGFQEVIGLGENVRGENEFKKFKILKNSILGGSIIANIITLIYLIEFYILSNNGVRIPNTPIPILDMLTNIPILYWATLITILLGVFTTIVPVFVASLKHLEQLGKDFFGIRTTGVLPYVVIIIAWYLFTTGAEFLIHLTDFAVLVSLAFIALSEQVLCSKLKNRKKCRRIIGKGIALITILMAVMLASHSRNIAEQSIVFMWLSTVIIMALSYDLTIVELFSVFVSIIAIIFVSPIIALLTDLANLGILKPKDIPIYEVSFIGLWALYISVIAIIIHLTIKYRQLLKDIVGSIILWTLTLLEKTNLIIKSKIKSTESDDYNIV